MTRHDAGPPPGREALEAWTAALQEMLPAGAVAEVRATADPRVEASPAEESTVARAVEKRQREFRAGRAAARDALARIGITGHDLLPGPRRAPRWPDGVVGSIAHTRGVAAAVVAPAHVVAGLGVDLEEDAPLERSLWGRICGDAELRGILAAHGIGSGAEPDPADVAGAGRVVRLHFSAKEAVYKAQFPVTQRFLEFHDVAIALRAPACAFEARLQPRGEPLPAHFPDRVQGAWRCAGGLLSCVAVVPPRPRPRKDAS